ncbi:ATP synthase F1 subunit epsilon [Candidatus Beckwithbacteria bacterium]|nr:ATP synthase F1 subunit epsilon [Candidatus Beckwithbacteria bacterium]
MRKFIKLSIITPTGTTFTNSNVESINAPASEGEITILPNHTPIFTKLNHGEIKVKIEGKESFFTIFQGFLNFDIKGNLTILADNAQRSEELNIEAIKKAQEAAAQALSEKEKLSATEILRAETAIRRAIMELKIAEKRKITH